MVMLRCLIVAVGAALARSDAVITQDKLVAIESAVLEGDHSFLNDVEAVRGTLDDARRPRDLGAPRADPW